MTREPGGIVTEPNQMAEREPLFTPRLERAIRAACQWHDGQHRKGSSIPYAEHLFGVAIILDRLGYCEDVLIAGLLHDAMEDAGITGEAIASEFGSTVAELVRDCSEIKRDPEGEPIAWHVRKREHLARLSAAPEESRAIALADKLHNLMALELDLERDPDSFGRFNATREEFLGHLRRSVDTLAQGDTRLSQLGRMCQEILDRLWGK